MYILFYCQFFVSDNLFACFVGTNLLCEVSKNGLQLHPNAPRIVGGWGSAPDPAGGAYDAPPDPLIVMASRLRRSHDWDRE